MLSKIFHKSKAKFKDKQSKSETHENPQSLQSNDSSAQWEPDSSASENENHLNPYRPSDKFVYRILVFLNTFQFYIVI